MTTMATMTTMTDPSPASLGDILQLAETGLSLIYEADRAHTADSEWHQAAQTWRHEFALFLARLEGNRNALRGQIMQALGEASMCWETLEGAGVFQSDRAEQIGERLLEVVDEYVDRLPYMRQANMVSLDYRDPAEALAAAIYEVSAQVGTGLDDDKWKEAQPKIKQVLTETASQLLSTGVVFFGERRPPSMNQPEHEYENIAPHLRDIPTGDHPEPKYYDGTPDRLPPNIPMPEFADRKGEVDDDARTDS